jgi:hypothetical protein
LVINFEKKFFEEIIQFSTNDFYANEIQSLLSNNSLHIFDKTRESIVQNKLEENIFMIDQTFHPKLTYLMAASKLYGLDRRSKDLNYYHIEKGHNFAIKHFKEQYFFMTRKKSIDVFDFRSMKKPIINLKHFQEENPPSSNLS